MNISKDGEYTTIDGEGHTTFIKREKFGLACFHIDVGVEPLNFHNLHWSVLKGNPFKDCLTLLRWYFSKS